MKRFLKKILLFVSPVVAVVGIYIILDPFMVVHHHSPFFERECYVGINPNVGYVSTMTYIENLPEQDYDSFIFGNSRSVHFLIDDWQPHIDPAARCFHFNADGESLYLMDVVGVEDTMYLDIQDRDDCLRVRKLVHECLTEREEEVITSRYGLGGRMPRTQREVAKKLGISRSYVSRIEKRALQKLEEALGERE